MSISTVEARNSAAGARRPEHPIAPLFLERWSPRAFTGEPIPLETLLAVLEAARWGAVSLQRAALALRICSPRHSRLAAFPRFPRLR